MSHTITFEGGDQDIVVVALDSQGKAVIPTTATYGIVYLPVGETDPDREIVASGTAATIDPASAVTTADAGLGSANTRRVELPVAGFEANRQYLIRDPDGKTELIRVKSVSTAGPHLDLWYDIPSRFVTGSTVEGVEITASFPSAEAADEEHFEDGGGPYRITWAFGGGFATTPVHEMIFVERTQVRPLNIEQRMIQVDPKIVRRSANGGYSVQQAVAAAYEDHRAWLNAHDLDVHEFAGDRTARRALVYDALFRFYSVIATGEVDLAKRDAYREERDMHRANLTTGQTKKKTVITDRANDQAQAGTSRKYLSPFSLA